MVRYPSEKEKEGLLSRLGEQVTVTFKPTGIPMGSTKPESVEAYRTLAFRLDAVNSYGVMGRTDNGEQVHCFFLEKWEESGALEHRMHREGGYERKILSITKGEETLYICPNGNQKSREVNSAEKEVQQLFPDTKITCGYCNKELDSINSYQYSSTGGKYCNRECFNLFTED